MFKFKNTTVWIENGEVRIKPYDPKIQEMVEDTLNETLYGRYTPTAAFLEYNLSQALGGDAARPKFPPAVDGVDY